MYICMYVRVPIKKNLITEARMQEQNCIERMSVMIPDDQDITVVEHMTQLNESQREVQRSAVINAPKLQKAETRKTKNYMA